MGKEIIGTTAVATTFSFHLHRVGREGREKNIEPIKVKDTFCRPENLCKLEWFSVPKRNFPPVLFHWHKQVSKEGRKQGSMQAGNPLQLGEYKTK